ncbi:MAG TPA: sugar ABC transporter substrate-binding protein [Feifaniaceae bacterium]|nr:sugar ABC transporter substrate-binding protein [Feifaniaceae bacterium]
MKRVFTLALVFVLLFSCFACAPAQTSSSVKEIAFLPPAMTSPFYASCIDGAKPIADKAGFELVVVAPESESDYAAQMQIMEDMITRKVAGIAVCGINIDALVAGVKKANEAGIPVVMFNTLTELAGGEVYAYSGYDQYNGGGKIADWVSAQTGGKANVAIIEGLPSDFTTLRMGGFVDRCAEQYPDVKVVATQAGDWEREKGMNAAANMLQAHPEINVFYGLSDEMALGAAQACKQANRDDIICIGLDGNPNAKEAVKNGELTATLDVGPVAIGANAIDALIKAINGQTIDSKIIEAETTVVDKTNVDQFL